MKTRKAYIIPLSEVVTYRDLCDDADIMPDSQKVDWDDQLSNSYDSTTDFEWGKSPWEEETSW